MTDSVSLTTVSEPSELSETQVSDPSEFLTASERVSGNGQDSDQGEHSRSDSSDTSDTGPDKATLKRLLGAMRDGSWLDGQEFPPLRYAVDGLLPEGFSLLIGPPKAGKSWLALGILLAVANGSRALGAIAMGRPRRVFYLALEDGDRRMQDRCRTILGEDPIPSTFHYQTVIEPGFICQTIEAFLHVYPDTALVVVDTLGKVMPQAMPGESSYQRDYRVAGRLKRIADSKPGLAITALHHDRKAASEDFVESVSGTNGLAGAADTIVVLARKRQSQEALLMVTGRDVPEAEYGMVLDDGLWRLDGTNLDEAQVAAQQRQDAAGLGDVSVSILQFVREHPDGCKAAAVVEKFGRDAYQYLSRLEERGDLTKIKRGVYRANESIFGTDTEAA